MIMSLYDETLWQRTTPEDYADEVTRKYGIVAWVDVARRFHSAKSGDAKEFSRKVLVRLNYHTAVSIEPPPLMSAEALLKLSNAVEFLTERIDAAEASNDDDNFLYWLDVQTAYDGLLPDKD